MGWEMVPVVRCGGDEVLLPVLLPWGTQTESCCAPCRVPDVWEEAAMAGPRY